MDFEKLCIQIDKNPNTKAHKYYQKLLVFLFLNNKDPFNRKLKDISVEKKVGKGVVDLFIKWSKGKREFTEIIEIELGGKKKTLENKIKLYAKEADLFSICIPSKKIDSLVSVFPKMRGILPNIKIVYLIDDEKVTINHRKLVNDQNMLISAQSPFFLINSKNNLKDFKEFVNSNKNLFFDALLPIYLK